MWQQVQYIRVFELDLKQITVTFNEVKCHNQCSIEIISQQISYLRSYCFLEEEYSSLVESLYFFSRVIRVHSTFSIFPSICHVCVERFFPLSSVYMIMNWRSISSTPSLTRVNNSNVSELCQSLASHEDCFVILSFFYSKLLLCFQ